MNQEYSKIFGERKYRALNILKEFCIKYYDYSVYDYLINKMDILQIYLNDRITNLVNIVTSSGYSNACINLPLTIEDEISKFIGGLHTPNGPMNFPDHILKICGYNDVHMDSKSVFVNKYDQFSYNNTCGPINDVAKQIYNFYAGISDKFYKSFVIYVYYNAQGFIYDVIFMPLIYTILLKKYNWDDPKTMEFAIKGNNNFNVPIGLPSFILKNGMETLEEKELLVATASTNFFENINFYKK